MSLNYSKAETVFIDYMASQSLNPEMVKEFYFDKTKDYTWVCLLHQVRYLRQPTLTCSEDQVNTTREFADLLKQNPEGMYASACEATEITLDQAKKMGEEGKSNVGIKVATSSSKGV
jgi:hypothetical protein